jgi:hypothetical protein
MPSLPTNPVGRPTKYDPLYAHQARKLCELGAINSELADFFCVAPRTIANWLIAHPDFNEAIRVGKAVVDDRVHRSLYELAVGHSVDTVQIDVANGRIFKTPLVVHIPPSVAAAKFWLCNRRPKEWSLNGPAAAPAGAPDLLAQIAADAPVCAADETGPANPVM